MENKTDITTSFYVVYAYDAMSQMIHAEIDRTSTSLTQIFPYDSLRCMKKFGI